MRRLGPTLLLFLAPVTAWARQQDTVALNVGHPSVDGRIYRPHLAIATLTRVKDGRTISTIAYTNDLLITTRNGSPVFRLVSQSLPNDPGPWFRIESEMDVRTLAAVHREERRQGGRVLIADVVGVRVTGTEKGAGDSAAVPLSFTLEAPSYEFAFLDAAIGATPLRLGKWYRVPTFSVASRNQRQTSWHLYQLTRQDTLNVGGQPVVVWVAREGRSPSFLSREVWLMAEPPYLPRVETRLLDGTLVRFDSWMVSEHP